MMPVYWPTKIYQHASNGGATRSLFEILFRSAISVSWISRDETYWKSFTHLAREFRSRENTIARILPAVMEYRRTVKHLKCTMIIKIERLIMKHFVRVPIRESSNRLLEKFPLRWQKPLNSRWFFIGKR